MTKFFTSLKRSMGGSGRAGLLSTVRAVILLALCWALASLSLVAVIALLVGLLGSGGLPDAKYVLFGLSPLAVKVGAGLGGLFGIGLRFLGRPDDRGLPSDQSVWRIAIFVSPVMTALLIYISTRGHPVTRGFIVNTWLISCVLAVALAEVTMKVITHRRDVERSSLPEESAGAPGNIGAGTDD